MPWRTEEDGTRSFVIWADLLAAQGYAVEDLVRQLLRDLGKEHRVVGWRLSRPSWIFVTAVPV